MNRDPIDDAARALFAAGARDHAPARLRAALLARSTPELRSGVAERVLRLPETPSSRRSSEPRPRLARWLWPVLSAAAVLVAAIVSWSVREPEGGVLISAEGHPAAAALPAPEQTLPVVLPETVPGLVEAGTSASREPAATRASPGQRPRTRTANPAHPQSGPVERRQAAPGPAEPPRAPLSAEAPRAAPDITQQLALLQQVQRALRAGKHQRALELLDEHASKLEHGDFDAEARLMRVEALAGAGQRAEADRLARDFLTRFPHSPLVDRARRLTEGAALGAP